MDLFEIFFDGKVIMIDDYKSIKGYGIKLSEISSVGAEKGHFEEFSAFYNAILNGDGYAIPLWQIEQTAKVSDLCQNYG